MSIEQLLFFLFLLAIPLLERMIRAMRARTDASPGAGPVAPAEPTGRRPPSPLSVAGPGGTLPEGRERELLLPASPLPPVITHAPPEQLHTAERESRVHRDDKQRRATGLRAGHLDRPLALRRIIAGADLRQAIVLLAVLGPCRALEPKDASQRGE